MNWTVVLLGALLYAVPALSQKVSVDPQAVNGEVLWFSINDSKDKILKVLGAPSLSANFGADFESWQ